ncbi:MAG: hypothetical protein KatS3mg056_0767 [Chloroflexus sp.]|jgi:hypothetical protein|nr:MAG: hypothetical protein KatS3mg056_0767 [Chloroflexus sp.]
MGAFPAYIRENRVLLDDRHIRLYQIGCTSVYNLWSDNPSSTTPERGRTELALPFSPQWSPVLVRIPLPAEVVGEAAFGVRQPRCRMAVLTLRCGSQRFLISVRIPLPAEVVGEAAFGVRQPRCRMTVLTLRCGSQRFLCRLQGGQAVRLDHLPRSSRDRGAGHGRAQVENPPLRARQPPSPN